MKSIFVLLAMLVGFSFSAFAQERATNWDAIEKFLGVEVARPATCVGEGYKCKSSLDCCSNWCKNGECYEIGGGCRGNGATCGSSLDCCSNWCKSGKCYEIGGCIPKGGDCERTFDCCSGSTCWRDKCD